MHLLGELAIKFIFKILCYVTGEIILSIFIPRKDDDTSDETMKGTADRIQTATAVGIFFWVDAILIIIIYHLINR